MDDAAWGVGGLRVRGRTWGEGPPLVLVHGLVISSWYWRPLAAHLPGRRLLAPDLPGFGLSDPAPGAPTPGNLASWLLRWMDALDLGEADIMAHSLGCTVALQLAADHPDRVGRLVLEGPIPPQTGWGLAQVGNLLADVPRERPLLWPREVPDVLRAGPLWGWRAWRDVGQADAAGLLARTRARALLLRGERDPLCPAPFLDALAATRPGLAAAIIPGVGHVAHDRAPLETARRVDGFLG